MVETKIHFCKCRITFILCYSSPSMSKSVATVIVFFLQFKHLLANLANTDIYICIKTIIGTMSGMEIKEELRV